MTRVTMRATAAMARGNRADGETMGAQASAVHVDGGIFPVAWWLRLEAIATLAVGLTLWDTAGGSWLVLGLLLLTPDLAMVGYAAGPRIGALAYDLAHNLALPGSAVAVGLITGTPWLVLVGALVVVHVGVDRLLGYGLKYPSGFRDTHLQRV